MKWCVLECICLGVGADVFGESDVKKERTRRQVIHKIYYPLYIYLLEVKVKVLVTRRNRINR